MIRHITFYMIGLLISFIINRSFFTQSGKVQRIELTKERPLDGDISDDKEPLYNKPVNLF